MNASDGGIDEGGGTLPGTELVYDDVADELALRQTASDVVHVKIPKKTFKTRHGLIVSVLVSMKEAPTVFSGPVLLAALDNSCKMLQEFESTVSALNLVVICGLAAFNHVSEHEESHCSSLGDQIQKLWKRSVEDTEWFRCFKKNIKEHFQVDVNVLYDTEYLDDADISGWQRKVGGRSFNSNVPESELEACNAASTMCKTFANRSMDRFKEQAGAERLADYDLEQIRRVIEWQSWQFVTREMALFERLHARFPANLWLYGGGRPKALLIPLGGDMPWHEINFNTHGLDDDTLAKLKGAGWVGLDAELRRARVTLGLTPTWYTGDMFHMPVGKLVFSQLPTKVCFRNASGDVVLSNAPISHQNEYCDKVLHAHVLSLHSEDEVETFSWCDREQTPMRTIAKPAFNGSVMVSGQVPEDFFSDYHMSQCSLRSLTVAQLFKKVHARRERYSTSWVQPFPSAAGVGDIDPTMLDSVPGHHWAKQEDGCYIYANKEQVTALGKSFQEEVVGKKDLDFDGGWGCHALPLMENDRRVIESGRAISVVELIATIQGVRLVLSLKAPFYKNGQVVGTVGCALFLNRDLMPISSFG